MFSHPFFLNNLVSCGYDRKVKIWTEFRKDKYKLDWEHEAHTQKVNGISVVPFQFGFKVISVGSDSKIIISQLNH